MSDLAFTLNGDPFDVPTNAVGWRVRKMKSKGAPEVTYGRNGQPLVLPLEADVDDLRGEVSAPGRYRLDPVDDENKPIANAPAGYVMVHELAPAPATHAAAAQGSHGDDAIREAMRLNADLARTIVENYAPTMTAAAELLRAADGAGLPARAPRPGEADIDEDEEDTLPRVGFDVNALLGQLAPLLAPLLANLCKAGVPSVGEALDWRKATPGAKQGAAKKLIKAPRLDGASDGPPAASATSVTSGAVTPLIDMDTMAHFIAVQSALTPDEASIARQVAKDLGTDELHAWFDELKKLSVPDAVAKVRGLIGGTGNGGAS